MRFCPAHIVTIELVLQYAATDIHNHFRGTTAPPVAACVTIHAAEAQNLEILVKCIAIAIETDKSKYRVGDSLRELKCLRTCILKRNDVSARRTIVN